MAIFFMEELLYWQCNANLAGGVSDIKEKGFGKPRNKFGMQAPETQPSPFVAMAGRPENPKQVRGSSA
jgi:hypothetical protein